MAGTGSWIFDGGALCVDFVNTLRDRWAVRPRETLVTAADLAAWLADAGSGSAFGACTDTDLVSARHLRAAVYRALRLDLEVADAVEINNAAARAPAIRLDSGGGRPSAIAPSPRAVAEALGAVAADLVRLVADGALTSVKECGHERCGLLYVDRSRGSRRRWCSMQRCGNRAKVAAFEQRHQR